MNKHWLLCLMLMFNLKTPTYAQIPIEERVIYEVFIRDATPEGTFAAFQQKLPQLKALGVNTLWLMPIHPVGKTNRKGPYGSPYAIADYYDVNPEFGTKATFKALVDAVHALNMEIIIDYVANHTAWDNKWLTEHPEWYKKDSLGKPFSPFDWTDVAQLDYDQKDLRAEMTSVLAYWIKTFNIDGYRCDVAELVPTSFWANAIKNIRQIKPVLMLAEGAKAELYDAGFDLTYGWEAYHQLKKVFKGASTLSMDTVVMNEFKTYQNKGRRIRFITNHDENSWDDLPQNLFNGDSGAKAAYVYMAFMGGTPFLYNGQEVGFAVRMNLFEKIPIQWSQDTSKFFNFYKDVLSTYNLENILKKGAYKNITLGSNLLAYSRVLNHEAITVIVNPRSSKTIVNLPVSFNIKSAKCVLATVPNKYKNINYGFALEPYEYVVFKNTIN